MSRLLLSCSDSVRGDDGVLGALMRGLPYDSTALGDAERLMPTTTMPRHLQLHELAQREGLEGKHGSRTLASMAGELVEIARQGLSRLDAADQPLLEPLRELAASGRSPARAVLEAPREPLALYARFAP